MAHATFEKRVFRRGSSVLEYWLYRADGFGVRSWLGVRSRVVRVIVDPDGGRAEWLVVRSRIVRLRRLIPAAGVSAVDPFACVFQLDRRYRYRLAYRAWRLALALAGAAAALARLAFVAAVWLRPRGRRLAAAAWTGGVFLARRFARGAAAAAAWLRPRLLEVAETVGWGCRELALHTTGGLRRFGLRAFQEARSLRFPHA